MKVKITREEEPNCTGVRLLPFEPHSPELRVDLDFVPIDSSRRQHLEPKLTLLTAKLIRAAKVS